jgi:hypothetical protein
MAKLSDLEWRLSGIQFDFQTKREDGDKNFSNIMNRLTRLTEAANGLNPSERDGFKNKIKNLRENVRNTRDQANAPQPAPEPQPVSQPSAPLTPQEQYNQTLTNFDQGIQRIQNRIAYYDQEIARLDKIIKKRDPNNNTVTGNFFSGADLDNAYRSRALATGDLNDAIAAKESFLKRFNPDGTSTVTSIYQRDDSYYRSVNNNAQAMRV